MSIGLQGQNLVFLISQPRAGSTLLQRILGSHPDIHTVSEPWLMLHPLCALRPDGHHTEYDAHLARAALQDFIQELPGGDQEYFDAVRRMYAQLYHRALVSSGKRYFLDKTPRYYHIIPELRRTFPKAHYIVLLRNPLAILCSILRAWTKGRWFSFYRSRNDLTQAPALLLEGLELLGSQSVIVRYEQLVGDPEREVARICNRLGVAFVPEMIEYGRQDPPRWQFGDQKEVYQHTHPIGESADKWVQMLDDALAWRLVSDYLQLLGQQHINGMGYSYEELYRLLEAERPHRIRLLRTFPLTWLLTGPGEPRRKWIMGLIRLMTSGP